MNVHLATPNVELKAAFEQLLSVQQYRKDHYISSYGCKNITYNPSVTDPSEEHRSLLFIDVLLLEGPISRTEVVKDIDEIKAHVNGLTEWLEED